MPGSRVRVPPLLLSKSSSPKGLGGFVISGGALAGETLSLTYCDALCGIRCTCLTPVGHGSITSRRAMPQHRLFDRYRAFGFASIALLFLTPAMPLGAQTLHGTLRTTAQGSPVAGAIIVLEDTLRVMQARTRSDEQGRFVLRAAAPRTSSSRVQPIR